MRHSPLRSITIGSALAALLVLMAGAAPVPGQKEGGAPSGVIDASTLYNAGTLALARGEVGPAVAFLAAAARIEPRAPDVRANLALAADAARSAGGERAGGGPFPLGAGEAWWLATALIALGAGLGIVRATTRRSRRGHWLAGALLTAGALGTVALQGAAWEERTHPEAVVIASRLSVERGPEEPSRPAVILSAGERVRLGLSRGGLVEIRVGRNSIGWAAREGLWRVADAPRYTSRFLAR